MTMIRTDQTLNANPDAMDLITKLLTKYYQLPRALLGSSSDRKFDSSTVDIVVLPDSEFNNDESASITTVTNTEDSKPEAAPAVFEASEPQPKTNVDDLEVSGAAPKSPPPVTEDFYSCTDLISEHEGNYWVKNFEQGNF